MYRENSENQIALEDFYLPFGGHLDPNNRWIILSRMVPWISLKVNIKRSWGTVIWAHLPNHSGWLWEP